MSYSTPSGLKEIVELSYKNANLVTVNVITPILAMLAKWRLNGFDSSLAVAQEGIRVLFGGQMAKLRTQNGVSSVNMVFGHSIDDVSYSTLMQESIINTSFVGSATTQSTANILTNQGLATGFIALFAFMSAGGDVGEIKAINAAIYIKKPDSVSITRVI